MEAVIHTFHGFYNSIHDSVLDNALESLCESNPKLREHLFDALNWQSIHTEYASKYVDAYNDLLNIDSKFIRLISPKYYNYETDRILIDVPFETIERIFKTVDRKILEDTIKSQYTSCSGFSSFYSNNINKWLNKPLEEWDCNEVGTLLYAYSTDEIGPIGAKDIEYKLIDSMDDSAYRIVGEAVPNRLRKIAYYLYEREQRK